MNLYVISGVTGMTGNEMARKLVAAGDRVIGFDNFFASSIDAVKDILSNDLFCFHEYDLNSSSQMTELRQQVETEKGAYKKLK